jgi:phosphoglycolate phosphatase-like HAD superfamily hydrolase
MDRSIFTSLIQKLGFEPTIDNITKAERRAEEIYIQTCNETPPSLPGIIDTLEALSKVPNVTLAVASGNLPGIAWRKLHLAGLDGYFPERFAGLGTLADRKDAILTAKSQAETAKGITFDAIIHIGDTPADAKAAIEAGVTAFCVRTGAYPLSQYPQPCYIFDSILEGHDQLWKLLELD